MKQRSDEEIAEEFFKARQKDPNAKPPDGYAPCEFSPHVLDAVRRSMMAGCTFFERRISRGKRLAQERRAREAEEAAGRATLPGKKIDK